ncbi:hypothetical protein KP509_1Z013500 [Ceratopteris richardii]|nr:hypothetical protein KP509_1Z013500 [Ceratopteris richardii]
MESEGGEGSTVVRTLIDTVNEITLINDFRRSHKRECQNVIRRAKLLLPLFEEVKDSDTSLPGTAVSVFELLEKALQEAKLLLQLCRDGSKLYLVLESESVLNSFYAVAEHMDKALDGMPWDVLGVSDEVREQVELLHAQIKRAKGRADTQDMELLVDVMLVLSQKEDRISDVAVLQRLADKLQLKTRAELKAEAHAVHLLIKDRAPEVDETLEQMCILLRKLRNLTDLGNSDSESAEVDKLSSSAMASVEKPGSPIVPDDFRCPISLELMRDPVIVATGQTYERASIERWLEGHRTCPKTRAVLPHTILTPNYVLRSLIEQWCETNGIDILRKASSNGVSRPNGTDFLAKDRTAVAVLIERLCSGQVDLQRAAAGELRSLAKQSNENRACIAEAGAIPHLVSLLATQDSRTQEHAVTALLNLSIHEGNKGAIVHAGAIPSIVDVLKHGSMEARENAAAALFSLSVVDEYKMTIGASGAIPALVGLLRHGNARGKKDAATALFNLSIYQGNKPRAVRAGAVEPLMSLLMDPTSGMLDEALAILAILATHQEGRAAIGNADAVPVLVELIKSGSSRNKENAAAILLALSNSDGMHLLRARRLGIEAPLLELTACGTARAKRKATGLLELIETQGTW